MLLRADSVFRSLGDPAPRYFPEFLGDQITGLRDNIMPGPWRPEDFMSNTAARQLAKALLEELGQSNASYMRMDRYGEQFVCGRCHDESPKNWVAMVCKLKDCYSFLFD